MMYVRQKKREKSPPRKKTTKKQQKKKKSFINEFMVLDESSTQITSFKELPKRGTDSLIKFFQ